jgi:hypothetical protein
MPTYYAFEETKGKIIDSIEANSFEEAELI